MDGLQESIMEETHNFRYSIHPYSKKMYNDLREVYWSNNMKRGIADFFVMCPNNQQVKVEHQSCGSLSHHIELYEWKWEMINIDFITSLPRFRKHHDYVLVIDNRMTKSAHYFK